MIIPEQPLPIAYLMVIRVIVRAITPGGGGGKIEFLVANQILREENGPLGKNFLGGGQ